MIYDFNLNNAAIQNLPPDKRQPRIILLLQALLSPLQYARDAFFGTYYTNDLSKRILYTGQRLVIEYALCMRFGYESWNKVQLQYKQEGTPSTPNANDLWYIPSTNILKKWTTSWNAVTPDSITVYIFSTYLYIWNGTTLTAITWSFRQATTPYETNRVSPYLPDIYTSKLSSVDCSFLIGLTEPHCSTIGLTEDYGNSFQLTYQDAIGVFKDWIYANNFTINIPTALYNAIPGATTYTTTDPLRNLIINKFVNTYIPIGMHFTITLI